MESINRPSKFGEWDPIYSNEPVRVSPDIGRIAQALKGSKLATRGDFKRPEGLEWITYWRVVIINSIMRW